MTISLRAAATYALTDFIAEHGSDFDNVEHPGMAALQAILGDIEFEGRTHGPGDPHWYSSVECRVCGQFGQIHISIEPQNVP